MKQRIYNRALAGQVFGRLTAVRLVRKNRDRRSVWNCRCVCGGEKEIAEPSLIRGYTRSCGCLWHESRVRNCTVNKWKHGKSRMPEGKLFYWSKHRAKKFGIAFDLDIHDIVIPKVCPLLKIPLFAGNSVKTYHPNSPSLDRKIPLLGYVKGNVWVISYKANMIKNSATLEEVERLARNWRAKI